MTTRRQHSKARYIAAGFFALGGVILAILFPAFKHLA